jgi:hypothetical protein
MVDTGRGWKSQWCSTSAGSSARSPLWHSWQYSRALYSHRRGPCTQNNAHVRCDHSSSVNHSLAQIGWNKWRSGPKILRPCRAEYFHLSWLWSGWMRGHILISALFPTLSVLAK